MHFDRAPHRQRGGVSWYACRTDSPVQRTGCISAALRPVGSGAYTRHLHESGRRLPIGARLASLPHFGLTGEIDNPPSTAAIASVMSQDRLETGTPGFGPNARGTHAV
jgi:hypothetical protein